MLNPELENGQFSRWSLTESPLVTFARGCRNEETVSQQQQQQQTADPFAGLNLDEFDETTRETLTKIKGAVTEQTVKLQADALKQAEIARAHQSRADKAAADLQRLQAGGQQQQQQQKTGNDLLVEKFTAQLVAGGIKHEVAEPQAKLMAGMFGEFASEFKKELGTALSPTLQSVGNIEADRALQSVMEEDTTGIFDDADWNKKITGTINTMVASGQRVDKVVVQNIKRMYLGEYHETNPEPKLVNSHQQSQQQQQNLTTRRPGFGGSLPVKPTTAAGSRNGAPSAMDAETEAAIKATVAGWNIPGSKTLPPALRKSQ